MALPPDPTLDEIRAALAPAIAANAGFDGWSDVALVRAARAEGVDPDIARLAFPGGAIDMIDAWFAASDAAMLAAPPPEKLATMKIREKITALVEARLALLAPNREALRHALAMHAMPTQLLHAAKLG